MVCLLVCHDCEPCKNNRTDRDAVWLRTRVGPRNCVFDGVQILPYKRQFRGEGTAHCKLQGPSVVSCAKMADPTEMPFVVWTRVGVSKHVSDGVHIGAT